MKLNLRCLLFDHCRHKPSILIKPVYYFDKVICDENCKFTHQQGAELDCLKRANAIVLLF